MNKKLPKKVLLSLMTLFLSLYTFAQLPGFNFTVTKTDQTCLGNGELNFAVSGTAPGATIDYKVYLQPNTTPLVTTTNTTVTNLTAGTYTVVATQSLGGETSNNTQVVTINNFIVPLTYGLSFTKVRCGNDGTITVNVTTGTASTYEIISGPVTRPLQNTNTFTGLPVGLYQVRVYDNCGEAVVVSIQLVQATTSFNLGTGTFSGGALPSCGTISVEHEINFSAGNEVFYPLTCQVTIFPPGGGAPIVTTQTINNGNIKLGMPFYEDQEYTYNIKITDACGNVSTFNSNTVDEKFTVKESTIIDGCGDNFFELQPDNYMPPYTVEFLSSPAGFNPLAFNPGHPTFSYQKVIYGGDGAYVPEGHYSAEVTDACGRTYTLDFDVEDPEIEPEITATASGACIGAEGTITIEIPGRTITHIEMIAAPAGYPGTLPQDVTSFVGPDGFLMSGLPLGIYSFIFTDSCDQEYTKEIQIDYSPTTGSLVVLQRAGCELGYASVRVSSSSDDLTNIRITAAPAAFTEILPFDGTSKIANDGRFYMNALPEGDYTFETTDSCGNIITEHVTIEGYVMTESEINIIPHCGSFDIEIHHSSNGNYIQGFFLQRYNDVEGVWEHPVTGTNYVEGGPVNISNSIALTNNTININLAFTGDFRIVKVFYGYNDGSVGNTRCVQELTTFTFDDGPVITDAYSFPCANDLSEVMVIATGVPPLIYEITAKDGTPFNVDNDESNIFSGLEAATYNFKVTDVCGNIRNILLDISTLDPIAIIPNGFCEGEDSTLAVPEYTFLTYKWWKEGAPGTILSTTGTLEFPAYDSTTDSGVYIVSIESENENSCINQELEYDIGINTVPNAGSDAITSYCNDGNPINLEDYLSPEANPDGIWEDLNATGALNGNLLATAALIAGTYQFKYTASGLCDLVDEAIITLEVKDLPQKPVLIYDIPVCVGSDLQLYATAVAGANFQWTGPNGFTSTEQNPLITNVTAAAGGIYSATITINDCTSEAKTLSVNIIAAPRAGEGGTVPLCNDGNAIDLMDFISGPHDNGGVWEDTNATGALTNNIFDPEGIGSGTYQFKYTVTNACNDTDEAIVTLELTDIPQLPTITGNEPVCEGDNIQLSTTAVAGAVYEWTGPGGFTSVEQNPIITNVATDATGTYSLTVTVNECVSPTATIAITVNAAPHAGEGDTVSLCNDGNAIDLMDFISGPHDNGGVWEDTNATGALTNTMFDPEGVVAGTYQFKYTVTNACNDTDEAIVTLELTDIPQIPSIEEIEPLCEGSTIQFTAVPVTNAVYEWTGPDGFTSAEQNPLIENASPAATGTYSLKVTVNGCSSPIATVPVTVNALPQFTVEGNTQLCDDQTAILTVMPNNFEPDAVVYKWYYEGSLLPEVTSGNVEIQELGGYEVVIDNNGCTTSHEIEITHNDNPFELIVDAGCINYDYMLWVVNAGDIPGATVVWTGPEGFSFTGPEANITDKAEGDYHVSVTNSEGCTVEAAITIDNTSCIIPKGISPNGDTKNDFFDLSNLDINEIKIFNRYGLKVYEAKNYKKEWYGQSDKGELPTGTYYYVITLSAGKQVTGWVYLQREIK